MPAARAGRDHASDSEHSDSSPYIKSGRYNAIGRARAMFMRLSKSIILIALAIALAAGPAQALELLMYRRAGCSWCAAWDRDIGPIYGKTEIGRRTPLRMIDLDRPGGHHVTLISPIRYTPTFVLVEQNREISRIEGYPGENSFWGLLEKIIRQLPLNTQSGLSAAPYSTESRE